MKHFLPMLPLAALLASCQYFERQPSKEVLLEQELKSINWKEVDEFPSVVDCEALHDKAAQRTCFFDYLAQQIQARLSIDTLSVLYPELDTIEVKVTVFPDSTLRFEPHFPKDSVAYDTVRIDSILHARLTDFPKVSPAVKRGIPVKTQFILPVILKME